MGLSAELVGAALVTLIGVGLTTAGVFTHFAPAVAPGALLTMLGGGWLGINLARQGVRLLPGAVRIQHSPEANEVVTS